MFTLPVYMARLRQDNRTLRIHNGVLNHSIEKHREKSRRLEEENDTLRKENDRLRKENGLLKEEIDKLTKTANRYRVSLFDHGNFTHPDETEKKPKGGQPGHADTNRESQNNPRSWETSRLSLSSCPRCHTPVHRVHATREKQLVDIVLNPQVVKLIVASERQWCGRCKQEVSARDERSLPFTEYGINTFMMAMLLRYRCLLPLTKISTVFTVGYGLSISESGLLSLFSQAKYYLTTRYETLAEIVRKGEILYTDETGWRVRGTGAWMWILAGEKATIYSAAESRGKGIAKALYGNSQAYAMHDGYAAYTTTIPPDKHLSCWAHMLRFAYEESVDQPDDHESICIRDKLVAIYRLRQKEQYARALDVLRVEAIRRLDELTRIRSDDPTVHAILTRLRTQKDGLIRALVLSPNGTNNFAEQELRPIALARRISYGSDTYAGMETTAILSSIVQTLVRTNRESFFPILKAYLQEGIVNS